MFEIFEEFMSAQVPNVYAQFACFFTAAITTIGIGSVAATLKIISRRRVAIGWAAVLAMTVAGTYCFYKHTLIGNQSCPTPPGDEAMGHFEGPGNCHWYMFGLAVVMSIATCVDDIRMRVEKLETQLRELELRVEVLEQNIQGFQALPNLNPALPA